MRVVSPWAILMSVPWFTVHAVLCVTAFHQRRRGRVAVPALLHAAERQVNFGPDARQVHVPHAVLALVAEEPHPPVALGNHRHRQPVLGVVVNRTASSSSVRNGMSATCGPNTSSCSHAPAFVFVRPVHERATGSSPSRRSGRGVEQHLSTPSDFASALYPSDLFHPFAVHQRPGEVGTRPAGRRTDSRFADSDERLRVLVDQRLVNDDAARGHAPLPGRLERAQDARVHGQVEPRVVAHDDRVLPAHLRRDDAVRDRRGHLLNPLRPTS